MNQVDVLPKPEACAPTSAYAIGLEAATSVAVVLKSLSDPLRVRMLSAIATDPRGESCVCDLAELTEVSQPTVSHHLKVLKGTGLISSERRGTWVWYRVTADKQAAVDALLDALAPAIVADVPEEIDPSAQNLNEVDARISRLAEELVSEFPNLEREIVVATVRESYVGLLRPAKVTRHLILLTERFARQRLTDLSRDRGTSLPQVLFVCVHNAGRSQLAEALVHKLAGGRVSARSAGSSPAANLHPPVRALIDEIGGAPMAGVAFPKPLTDDAVRAADVVVTMGCGDVCPAIPGVRYEDWAVGDPALASADGLLAIRADIETRVRSLLDSLNID